MISTGGRIGQACARLSRPQIADALVQPLAPGLISVGLEIPRQCFAYIPGPRPRQTHDRSGLAVPVRPKVRQVRLPSEPRDTSRFWK